MSADEDDFESRTRVDADVDGSLAAAIPHALAQLAGALPSNDPPVAASATRTRAVADIVVGEDGPTMSEEAMPSTDERAPAPEPEPITMSPGGMAGANGDSVTSELRMGVHAMSPEASRAAVASDPGDVTTARNIISSDIRNIVHEEEPTTATVPRAQALRAVEEERRAAAAERPRVPRPAAGMKSAGTPVTPIAARPRRPQTVIGLGGGVQPKTQPIPATSRDTEPMTVPANGAPSSTREPQPTEPRPPGEEEALLARALASAAHAPSEAGTDAPLEAPQASPMKAGSRVTAPMLAVEPAAAAKAPLMKTLQSASVPFQPVGKLSSGAMPNAAPAEATDAAHRSSSPDASGSTASPPAGSGSVPALRVGDAPSSTATPQSVEMDAVASAPAKRRAWLVNGLLVAVVLVLAGAAGLGVRRLMTAPSEPATSASTSESVAAAAGSEPTAGGAGAPSSATPPTGAATPDPSTSSSAASGAVGAPADPEPEPAPIAARASTASAGAQAPSKRPAPIHATPKPAPTAKVAPKPAPTATGKASPKPKPAPKGTSKGFDPTGI